MTFGEDKKIKIQWKPKELGQIETITYIDTIISNENIMDEEINKVTSEKEISTNVKTKIY